MGRVCKRLKDTKAKMKKECVKSDCTRNLATVAAMLREHGNAKSLVTDLFEQDGERGDVVMDFESRVMVESRAIDEIHALCSPARFIDVVPLMNESCKTPRTPCKKQAYNRTGSPRTPCIRGRFGSTPCVLANLMRSPKTPCTKSRFQSSPFASNNLLKTPKTPSFKESIFESRLESLPIDILMKVICHLHHDQLKPAFHVSRRVREAVQLARQFHFNFTTPDRSRQAILSTTTPQPWEHWPFVKNRNDMLKQCPKTPKAPRHSSRPPPKFDSTDVCPIDDALFQESAFPSSCSASSSLIRSVSKSQLASNRVLFYSNDSNFCNSLL